MKLPTKSEYERREQERRLKELSFSGLPYLERADQLKEQKFPLFFYKYHSLHLNNPENPNEKWEHARDYLINSQFYLSAAKNFNDPFDMKADVTDNIPKEKKRYFLEKTIERMQPHLTLEQRVLEIKRILDDPRGLPLILKFALEEAVELFGVSCLSTDPCNILMWSHYANHHRGIIFQFNYAKDIKSFQWLQPVSYSNKYPVLEFFDRQISNRFSVALLRKHCGWAYEKEWRFVKPEGAGTYQSFDPKILTGVILGCRIDSEAEDRVRAMIDEREKLKPPNRIKLYRVRQHEARYRLVLSKS